LGSTVLAGSPPVTTAVAFESAVAVPSPFVAVTSTRSRRPTSELTTAYVWPVAPEMAEQLEPELLQRCQRYENVIGADPLQLPLPAVSVEPLAAVPEMVGKPVFAGAT
jgi:hypothetical protein